VVLNAGAALYVARATRSLADGVKMADAVITSGKARLVLDAFVAASNLTS
jgi:anthranilate phosphoribosyltransferase